MKKLRIGFSAVVGIVSTGLMIAAQAGIFKEKSAKTSGTDCFDVRTLTGLGLPIDIRNSACSGTFLTLKESVLCSKTLYLGYGVFTDLVNPAAHPVVGPPAVVCPGDFQICCIIVMIDESPCAGQPEFDIGEGTFPYVVADIFCSAE